MTTETNEAAIRSILLASPPGQFDIIVEDLRSLLPKSSIASLLEPDFISALRSEWDSATGRSILAAADGNSAGAGIEDDDGCIAALSKSTSDYLASKFSSPGVRAAFEVTSSTVDDARTITIAIYGERIDLHNHYAGSWKGSYAVCPSSGSICGNVSIRAHTFENGGNVQLHSNIALEATTIGTYSASDSIDKQSSWASVVARKIELFENQVMENLADMYENQMESNLKCLRRVMPITRTKMDWNVLPHRMVHTLGEGHNKDKFKH